MSQRRKFKKGRQNLMRSFALIAGILFDAACSQGRGIGTANEQIQCQTKRAQNASDMFEKR
jgi:hypothetical protein